LFEDKNENERRLKSMRLDKKQAIIEKHEVKGKKISEMRRIFLNKDKEPVESLYGSMVL